MVINRSNDSNIFHYVYPFVIEIADGKGLQREIYIVSSPFGAIFVKQEQILLKLKP